MTIVQTLTTPSVMILLLFSYYMHEDYDYGCDNLLLEFSQKYHCEYTSRGINTSENCLVPVLWGKHRAQTRKLE